MDTLDERRQAATHQYAIAAATINTMFDRNDELRATLTTAAAVAAGPDPLRAAHELTDLTARIGQLVDQLVTAAAAATAYRPKTDLAADINTRTALLFPRTRPAERAPSPLPTPVDPALLH